MSKSKRPDDGRELLICHTCEARRGGKHRVIVRPDMTGAAEKGRFLDLHRDCARNGWGSNV